MVYDARSIQKPDAFSYKQIIIVRKDIKMSKGKLGAQVAHASTLALLDALNNNHKDWVEAWLNEGFPKVVLKANNLEELIDAFDKASKIGLPCSIVKDFGLTELEPGTVTCIGIGPAPIELVDKIGKQFRLY